MENLDKAVQFDSEKDLIESKELEKYKFVQQIAKDTMSFLSLYLKPGMTENEIANIAEYYMQQKGVESFWYHGVGALVFVGERTTLSISGKGYKPSDEKVKPNDIVTVDLSPEIEGCWGDFARTFVVADEKVILPEKSQKDIDPDMADCLKFEEMLHQKFQGMISESMTLEEAYRKINSLIEKFGFENLDFKGNLGHSIEKNPDDRIYIEAGNRKTFGEIGLFTFEPHIRKTGGKYGFKREDVYYFKGGKLNIL